ncbi:Bpu10I family restriction endonuclease [Akkermansiaceae bacterium]|nr:Bpu10I family restriction endonuclease [Akkermansiaceae bacterium]
MENAFLNHKTNLEQKARIAQKENIKVSTEASERYTQFINELVFPHDSSESAEEAVSSLNSYLDFAKELEKKHSFFNWRSNYAGSIIPEFYYRYLSSRFSDLGVTSYFSTKASVVEATFSVTETGGIDIRRKDQDLSVGVRNQKITSEEEEIPFVVPVVCCEMKTNIDINKLNGLDFSAERLKRSFPGATYFLITETIDFSLSNNYAAGSIDEIFVLRKQVRSASRRSKDPLQADVIKESIEEIIETIVAASHSSKHVYDRLPSGRLIQNDVE